MHKLSSWEFDGTVSDVFDTHVRQSVPLYDSIQQIVIHLADFFIESNHVIYDLGCATGETIYKINSRHFNKNLQFIGIDDSQAMLEKAKEKNTFNQNVSFIQHRIETYQFEQKSNLMLSVLTLQFLPVEKRQQMLNNIYQSLNKGGALLLVEKTYAFESRTQEMFTQIYHDYKEEHGLTTQEIRDKDKSLRGVMNLLSVSENFKRLHQAGFKTVDVFFKYLNFTGFVAIKG